MKDDGKTSLQNTSMTFLENYRWTDRVRNEEEYRRIDEVQTKWSIIRKRRTRWIGHILRQNGFVRKVLEDKIEGKAPRGRPRDKYINQIKKDIGKKRYIRM
ncbi:hypothetical protein J437_LFUL005746 [Ladona fulva]|uniref:Uncharacterized protein n=1 Tax=Ladona fulva TaxID=123851 RepID=A0A8K0K1P0_LADFU|nr:hypothetical protein J437_LFUL005746 [Ladona fulva]